LREREDRLLRAERRHDLGVRVDGDAEAPADPARDRLSQLRQPRGARVGRALPDRRLERLADEARRRLPGVADAEVDHVAPGAPLVEAGEGVLLELGEHGREEHRYTLPASSLRSASKVRTSSATSTRSSAACA